MQTIQTIKQTEDKPYRLTEGIQEPWRELNNLCRDSLKGSYNVLFYNIEDCNKMPEKLKFIAFDWENLEILIYREPSVKVLKFESYNHALHNIKINTEKLLKEGLRIQSKEEYKRIFFFKDLDKQEIKELRKGDKIIKTGDILNTNWGYDQTNVELFVIKKIIGKNYMIIQEIAKHRSSSGSATYYNVKVADTLTKVDLPVKAYISNDGYMSVCEHGYKRSLSLTTMEAEHYETNSMFGH